MISYQPGGEGYQETKTHILKLYYLLQFDFTEQAQLSANKSGKNISIYFNKAPVFDVERFLCSKILKDKDCNSIVE